MQDEQHKPTMYTPLQTVVITIGLFFGAQFLLAFLYFGVTSSQGWSIDQSQSWLSDSSWRQFAFLAAVEATMLSGLAWFLRQRQLTFKSIGFNTFKLKHLGYAVVGFLVYIVTYVVMVQVASNLIPGFNVEQKQELGFDMATTGRDLVPIFISLVILPPLVEEIVARGFLFKGLRSKLPFMTAALVTSAIFAAAHLNEASDGLLWVAALDTFILSLVMCYVREKTDSLWPSIGMHVIKNGLAFAILFNVAQYLR